MAEDLTKVYTFLSTKPDWSKVADKNGDGVIIKSEMRTYLEENLDWDGETTAEGKNDLINEFWNAIDTNTTGTISNTKLKNKNALDSKEIENAQARLEMYVTLDSVVGEIPCPSNITKEAAWRKEIKNELNSYVEMTISSGGTPQNLDAILRANIDQTANQCTISFFQNDYLGSMKSVFAKYNYDFNSDPNFTKVMNNYIATINDSDNPETITTNLKNVIDSYLSTAGLAQANGVDLSQYGYTADPNGGLNDLQKAVLGRKLELSQEEVKNEPDYAENKETYDAAIQAYVDTALSEAKYSDFNKLNASVNVDVPEPTTTAATTRSNVAAGAAVAGYSAVTATSSNSVAAGAGSALETLLIEAAKTAGNKAGGTAVLGPVLNTLSKEAMNGNFAAKWAEFGGQALEGQEITASNLGNALSDFMKKEYNIDILKQLGNTALSAAIYAEVIKIGLSTAIDVLPGMVKDGFKLGKDLVTSLGSGDIGKFAETVFVGAPKYVLNTAVSAVTSLAKNTYNEVKEIGTIAVTGVYDIGKTAVTGTVDTVKSNVETVVDTAENAAGTVKDVFSNIFKGNLVGAIGSGVKGVVKTAVGAVKGLGKTALTGLKTGWNVLKSGIGTVGKLVNQVFGNPVTMVKSAVSLVGKGISAVGNAVGGAVKSVGKAIGKIFKGW